MADRKRSKRGRPLPPAKMDDSFLAKKPGAHSAALLLLEKEFYAGNEELYAKLSDSKQTEAFWKAFHKEVDAKKIEAVLLAKKECVDQKTSFKHAELTIEQSEALKKLQKAAVTLWEEARFVLARRDLEDEVGSATF